MSEYLKIIKYVTVSHILISFINFLLLMLELFLTDPPVTDHFPGELDIDMLIWILTAISAVFTVSAYTYVGIKAPRHSNTLFNVLMVLLPAVFTYAGCIIMEFGSPWILEIAAMFLDSLLGIFIFMLNDTAVKYLIAAVPSALMFIGYIAGRGDG